MVYIRGSGKEGHLILIWKSKVLGTLDNRVTK